MNNEDLLLKEILEDIVTMSCHKNWNDIESKYFIDDYLCIERKHELLMILIQSRFFEKWLPKRAEFFEKAYSILVKERPKFLDYLDNIRNYKPGMELSNNITTPKAFLLHTELLDEILNDV